jgi:hypothetical protein
MNPKQRITGASPIMRTLCAAMAMTFLACASRSVGRGLPRSIVVAYAYGRWFNGSRFEWGTLNVEIDRFVSGPRDVERIVDLRGYVVPPLGEAHNHNLGPSANVGEQIARSNGFDSSSNRANWFLHRPLAAKVSGRCRHRHSGHRLLDRGTARTCGR